MSKKKKKTGVYSSVVNLIICVVLAALVGITLFGNRILELLPSGVQLNFSSFSNYLPLSEDGVPNGVIVYVLSNGWKIEPQAIILQVVIYLCAISIFLSILSLITRKNYGKKLVSILVMVAAVGALALFIFTYGLEFDGALWKDINAFFTSIFTIGIMGGWMAPGSGAMAVFSTYLLIAGFGITSFFVSMINK